MATFGTTDISYNVDTGKGETCNVHGYYTPFKSHFNGRTFVVRFTFFPAVTPEPNLIPSVTSSSSHFSVLFSKKKMSSGKLFSFFIFLIS